MAERAKRAPKKAPRMRLSKQQRERFLAVLGETGNRRLAAEAIGVEPRLMDQRRRYDRLLDRQWREALERAERRLAAAAGPIATGRASSVPVRPFHTPPNLRPALPYPHGQCDL